jgi:hypothetical protein
MLASGISYSYPTKRRESAIVVVRDRKLTYMSVSRDYGRVADSSTRDGICLRCEIVDGDGASVSSTDIVILPVLELL